MTRDQRRGKRRRAAIRRLSARIRPGLVLASSVVQVIVAPCTDGDAATALITGGTLSAVVVKVASLSMCWLPTRIARPHAIPSDTACERQPRERDGVTGDEC